MLEGNTIQLIPPRKEFIPTFTKWMNDREVLQYVVQYKPISHETEEQWFDSMINHPNAIIFSIMKISESLKECLIGNVTIRIHEKDRVGNIGIMIGEKSEWGKGYGTEALNLLANYAFNTLNLQRIELEVHSTNPRAQNCYKKVGFIEEGLRRRAHFIMGKYIDSIMMGLLKEEWNLKKEEY